MSRTLTVNGVPTKLLPGTTLGQLLRERFPERQAALVKLDGKLVPRAEQARLVLPEDGALEIIHLVSGG